MYVGDLEGLLVVFDGYEMQTIGSQLLSWLA